MRETPPTGRSHAARLRTALRRSALALLLAAGSYGVFLGALHLFLNSAAGERLINRRPERWSVRWESAWSLVPWRVHLRDVTFMRSGRSHRLEVSLERAVVDIEPRRLFGRELRSPVLHGAGVDFAVVQLPPSDPASPSGPASPSDPAAPPAPDPEPAPARSGRSPGWQLELEDVRLDDVQTVTLEDVTLRGHGAATMAISARVGGDFAVPSFQVKLAGFTADGGGVDGSPVDIEAAGSLSPFSPRQVRGRAVLRHLDSTLRARGEAPLDFLDAFLQQAAWIDGIGGRGQIEAELRIDGGRLGPGSRLDAETRGLSYSAVGLVAEGGGHARLVADGEAARLEVSIDDFAVRRAGLERPDLRGERLSVVAVTADPDLVSGFGELDVTAEIAGAEMADLTFLNNYLPKGSGINLLGGAARLEGELHANTGDHRPTGVLELRGEGLRAAVGDVKLEGALRASVVLSGGDLLTRRFELDGSRLRVDGITFEEPGRKRKEGGWLRAELARARLGLAASLSLDADLAAGAPDTRVLLALLAERKHWLDHFDRLLTIRDLETTANLRIRESRLELRQIRAEGRSFHLEAEMKADAVSKSALVFAKYHGLTFGLETGDGKPRVKVLRARDWYEEALEGERWARRPEDRARR